MYKTHYAAKDSGAQFGQTRVESFAFIDRFCGKPALRQDPDPNPKNAPLRGWEFFGRVRATRQNVPNQGAKHSHSSGYGAHLQRRVGAFWRGERA
jgi:hypothetical protein